MNALSAICTLWTQSQRTRFIEPYAVPYWCYYPHGTRTFMNIGKKEINLLSKKCQSPKKCCEQERGEKTSALLLRSIFADSTLLLVWICLMPHHISGLIYIQALFLSTFSVAFRTLLHASTMSQTIPDIHSSSQIFPVSEGMSF